MENVTVQFWLLIVAAGTNLILFITFIIFIYVMLNVRRKLDLLLLQIKDITSSVSNTISSVIHCLSFIFYLLKRRKAND